MSSLAATTIIMRHLSPDSLLSLAEGTTPDPRTARHLAACDRCRAERQALSATIGALRALEVPEPSPLFWDHLSRRVRDRVDADEGTRAVERWRPFAPPRAARGWTIAATVLLLAGVVTLGVRDRWQAGEPPGGTTAGGATIRAAALDERTVLPPDDTWETVVSLAESADWSGASPSMISGEVAELSVADLTTDERRELARLLGTELEGRRHDHR